MTTDLPPVVSRDLRLGGWPEVSRIFEAAIATRNATFETAGVFPENAASLALHLRCGFRVVGTRERIGRLDGVWRDVVLLERRTALPA